MQLAAAFMHVTATSQGSGYPPGILKRKSRCSKSESLTSTRLQSVNHREHSFLSTTGPLFCNNLMNSGTLVDYLEPLITQINYISSWLPLSNEIYAISTGLNQNAAPRERPYAHGRSILLGRMKGYLWRLAPVEVAAMSQNTIDLVVQRLSSADSGILSQGSAESLPIDLCRANSNIFS